MSLAAKEYTPEELDALEAQAKQRPVYDQIAGGVGAAMAYYDGPQESKAEYTPEELDARDALYAQPEMTPEELDQRLVNAKYDANTLLAPEQLKEADAVEKRLRDQGKQPGVMDTAFALGGGILQSVADWNMALDKSGNVKAAVKNALIKTGAISGDYERMPMLEAALQAPASAKAGIQGATLNAMETAIALNGLAKGKPRYRVKETGEFVFAPLGGVAPITQLAGEGKTLVPVTDADLEEHRYQQYATENAIRKTYLDLTSEEVFGQKPNQSFTLPVEILADPWNAVAFGAANKVTGASRMGKLFSSKTLGAAEAVAGGSANIIDKGADVFTKAVQKMSFGMLKRDTQRAIAKSAAYGGGAAAIGTLLTNAPSEARNTALTLMSLYPMYKMGSGVLRRVQGAAGTGKLIMREAADATNGLDDVARAAVASNPRVPQQIREALTNPSKFTPIESTPARIAKSEAFSPRVREVAARLANPLVVQASRAAGATARGAALGTALNIPFAEAYREMGDERTADSVYAGGLLFGAAGGAASRVTGARARRRDAAASDIGRMLVDIQKTNAGEDIGAPGVSRAFETYYSMAEPGRMLTDVELAGGDIDSLLRNTKFEDLAGMAAMQGFYRDTVDFVPLNAFDYEANVKALGGTGTAGYFLHAPEGQRARLFLNTDARRTDVAPHEYGHALLQSAATAPEMKNSARAFINQRYGPERLDAMAREYATQLIKNRNAKAYPDQKLDVSQAEIDSMIYELGESGLGRGDGDRLDWLRDEIFAEEHRAAGIDYAQIRRNIPDGFSVVGFAENVLGANARALGVAGVPIDPQTGALQTPPDRLFKDNPLLAADSVMRRNVQQYVRAYKQWLNDPAHEVPTGAPVSRTGNPNELKNNPNVTFRDYGNGRLENELAFIDENGNVKVRDKKNDPERAKFIRARQQQVREMIDRGTKEPNDPTFGARVRDGQRIVAGKKLPPRFDMTRFPSPLKELARRMETLAEAGETMQVRYFALGKSKDVFKQGDIRGVQAINREVMFVEWQATKDGNINAFVVDLTQFRNRAMKAIADRDPSLSEINWDFKQLEADLRRVLDNHANGRAGADGIGDKRRNAVNALLGIGTKTNRIANPLTGLGGKGSALKTLRLDAFDEVAGTGRQGFEFDYQKANGNFMPDKPAPRPDMDSDLELPNRMPSALPQSGMAMPEVAVRGERADIPLNPQARQAAFISDRGEVRSTGRATHFETNEDLGPDFLAIGAGHLGEDGFFRFGSQTMDDAMGESPTTSAAAAARFNQSVYDQGRRPSAMLEEPPGLERASGRGQTGQAMPDADQPRRYVSMEKFIEEAGDDLGEVLPNAYRSIEFNDDDYPTHLVSFSDTRNSMYRSRVPSKEFFDWLHSDQVMDGLVFDKEYTPARPGEGAGHTRESYQAVIDRLRKISLKPSTGRTRGQAMPDVGSSDQGVTMPKGTVTQLTNTARKALPKLPQGAKSVPKLVIKRIEKSDIVVDGGNPKSWKDYADQHLMPLPNIKLDKVKGVSFSKQDIYDVAQTDRARAQANAQQSVQAAAMAAADPMKFVDPVGYSEIMRASGVVGDILIPPSGLKLILTDPKAFVGLLDGGFHGKRTVPGTRAAALQGLDGVTEMRQLVGGQPSSFNTALHHFWGTLSKQLDVINQEAAWMRLVLDPAIIEAIDMSINGTFSMQPKAWEALVAKALDGTKGDFRGKGNNAKSNANSFYKALVYHNGRWDEVAALYANNNAIDMRAQFNALGHGKVGMKNKVQGFVGLSFGIKGSVLDRWRFVDLYLPDAMGLTGAATPEQYFKYVGAQKVIPQDPIGIYKNYGTLENGNPAFSLALYNSLDSVAQVAISNSPELRNYLGAHADPGGLHWVTWNSIKNEAVGHSSLDITKNFVRQYGRNGSASDFAKFMRTAEGFVEGSNDAGQTIRLSLKNGVFKYSEQ